MYKYPKACSAWLICTTCWKITRDHVSECYVHHQQLCSGLLSSCWRAIVVSNCNLLLVKMLGWMGGFESKNYTSIPLTPTFQPGLRWQVDNCDLIDQLALGRYQKGNYLIMTSHSRLRCGCPHNIVYWFLCSSLHVFSCNDTLLTVMVDGLSKARRQWCSVMDRSTGKTSVGARCCLPPQSSNQSTVRLGAFCDTPEISRWQIMAFRSGIQSNLLKKASYPW